MNLKELDERVVELSKQAKLDSWNSFVEELQIPSEVYPALLTNRPELIRLARPRPLNEEEVAALYKLIAGLLETNQALRLHAQQVGDMTREFSGALRGVITTAVKLKRFAQFRHDEVDDEDELELEA